MLVHTPSAIAMAASAHRALGGKCTLTLQANESEIHRQPHDYIIYVIDKVFM